MEKSGEEVEHALHSLYELVREHGFVGATEIIVLLIVGTIAVGALCALIEWLWGEKRSPFLVLLGSVLAVLAAGIGLVVLSSIGMIESLLGFFVASAAAAFAFGYAAAVTRRTWTAPAVITGILVAWALPWLMMHQGNLPQQVAVTFALLTAIGATTGAFLGRKNG